jgi:hypothetical protein
VEGEVGGRVGPRGELGKQQQQLREGDICVQVL